MLKAVKRRCEEVKEAIKGIAGKLPTDLNERLRNIKDALNECNELTKQIDEVKSLIVPGSKSVEELKAIQTRQAATLQEKQSKLQQARANKEQLGRLLGHHQSEMTRLTHSIDQGQSKLQSLKTGSGHTQSQVVSWLKGMLGLCQELSRVKCEMIRPDYLLVTVFTNESTTLPVHLSLDPKLGKLTSVQIGSTTPQHTPKQQWKTIVDAAIEANDIPFLIRQITQQVCK